MNSVHSIELVFSVEAAKLALVLIVLGSSRCKKCSSLIVLTIIPSFILSGLLLVIFLMLLNLTVSVGTINGLFFYVNII